MKINDFTLHKDDEEQLEGVDVVVEDNGVQYPFHVVCHYEEIDVYYGCKEKLYNFNDHPNLHIPSEVMDFGMSWLRTQPWFGREDE